MATARKNATTASVRSLLGDALKDGVTRERLDSILEAAFGAETSAAAECPECGHTMRVKIPDFGKQANLIVEWIEQSEGKSSQAIPEATKIVIVRPPL